MRWKWLAVLAVMGCNGEEPIDTDSTATDDPVAARIAAIEELTPDTVAGESGWNTECESCHAGQAATFSGMAADDLMEIIIVGPGSMPPLANLPDQQIADITAYVNTSGM